MLPLLLLSVLSLASCSSFLKAEPPSEREILFRNALLQAKTSIPNPGPSLKYHYAYMAKVPFDTIEKSRKVDEPVMRSEEYFSSMARSVYKASLNECPSKADNDLSQIQPMAYDYLLPQINDYDGIIASYVDEEIVSNEEYIFLDMSQVNYDALTESQALILTAITYNEEYLIFASRNFKVPAMFESERDSALFWSALAYCFRVRHSALYPEETETLVPLSFDFNGSAADLFNLIDWGLIEAVKVALFNFDASDNQLAADALGYAIKNGTSMTRLICSHFTFVDSADYNKAIVFCLNNRKIRTAEFLLSNFAAIQIESIVTVIEAIISNPDCGVGHIRDLYEHCNFDLRNSMTFLQMCIKYNRADIFDYIWTVRGYHPRHDYYSHPYGFREGHLFDLILSCLDLPNGGIINYLVTKFATVYHYTETLPLISEFAHHLSNHSKIKMLAPIILNNFPAERIIRALTKKAVKGINFYAFFNLIPKYQLTDPFLKEIITEAYGIGKGSIISHILDRYDSFDCDFLIGLYNRNPYAGASTVILDFIEDKGLRDKLI